MAYFLRCISCKKKYEAKKDFYYCPDCGDRKGTLEVIYDYENIRVNPEDFDAHRSIFQFEKLLPVKSHTAIDQYIGNTPLLRYKDILGMDELLIKYDGNNLSSSYKDRASIIAINKAIEEQTDTIFCASTGNAASSLALLSSMVGLNTYIFVPKTIPIGKRMQLEISSAKVIGINATYDEVFDLSMEIGFEKGWYCRNSAINPYLLEGKKTGAYEIIVQNEYQPLDYVFVGVGDGTVISSLYKGFYEFYQLGLIDKIPKIIGVQSENIDAVKRTFEQGKPYDPIDLKGETIADSIAVGKPRDVIKACQYIERSNGKFIALSDEAIKDSIIALGQQTGIFAEPAGAVSFGGLKKMIETGEIKKDDKVCIVVTGNGLKDPNAVKDRITNEFINPEDVKKVIE